MKNRTLLLIMSLCVLNLVGCTQQVNLEGKEGDLAQRQVTEASEAIIYPDDNPSVPDGKLVYEKMNCAECHGATGSGITDKCSLDLTDKAWAGKQKPVDEYVFLAYGSKGVDHLALKDKLTRRELWDLVFYSRSLSTPAITDKEFGEIDPVFGANCAVCHGKRGHGDGPLAKNMEPVPANFHQFNRFYDRTDDLLVDHIAHGIKWEGMPDFLNKTDKAKSVKFDEAYIHRLVQYIRNFHSSNVATLAAASAKTSLDQESAKGPLEK